MKKRFLRIVAVVLLLGTLASCSAKHYEDNESFSESFGEIIVESES